jgi:hypothetical protein
MSNPLPDVIKCENCAAYDNLPNDEGSNTCRFGPPVQIESDDRYVSWPSPFSGYCKWCLSGCWEVNGMWVTWEEIRRQLNDKAYAGQSSCNKSGVWDPDTEESG